MSTTDRIEASIELHVPRKRVWRALTDSGEFGQWFGVAMDGPFSPGARVRGRMTIKGYEHFTMEITIDAMEPEHRFSYRWHPGAIDPNIDYSAEPMTLVEFTLEEIPGGTRLTMVETGFDRIPASRRPEAFRMNTQGWTAQMRNIERYVSQSS